MSCYEAVCTKIDEIPRADVKAPVNEALKGIAAPLNQGRVAMKIFITGGLGFVGSYMLRHLLQEGHRVTATGTRPDQNRIDHEHFQYISADTTRQGPWQEALEDVDAVINLAGRSIFKRWTKQYKTQIYDSRILTTRNLVDALPSNRPVVLCSASGVGIYGDRSDDRLGEDQPPAKDFLAGVSVDWEAEAFKAEEKGVRVAVARFGVVIGKGGGAMGKMIPAFRFFAGGPLGGGGQWFPWIHMDDLMAAFRFVLGRKDARGAFNFCSPNPVRNRELAKAMGRVLKRPAVMPAPGFAIRLVMGQMGSLVLFSQRAVPDKLLDHGFRFQYPEIEGALASVVK